MFYFSKWSMLAAVAACCVTDAFVPQTINTATPRQLVKDARATWTGRPSSVRIPCAVNSMRFMNGYVVSCLPSHAAHEDGQ